MSPKEFSKIFYQELAKTGLFNKVLLIPNPVESEIDPAISEARQKEFNTVLKDTADVLSTWLQSQKPQSSDNAMTEITLLGQTHNYIPDYRAAVSSAHIAGENNATLILERNGTLHSQLQAEDPRELITTGYGANEQ